MPQLLRVLFVCAGNTCRSPMAEALLRHRLTEAGIADRVIVDSAGASARPGDPVNPAALQVLAAAGIVHHGEARRFEAFDCERCQWIIALDRATLAAVEVRCGRRDGIQLLMDFASETRVQDVFDPYGTDRYQAAFDLIAQGIGGLLEVIRKELGDS